MDRLKIIYLRQGFCQLLVKSVLLVASDEGKGPTLFQREEGSSRINSGARSMKKI